MSEKTTVPGKTYVVLWTPRGSVSAVKVDLIGDVSVYRVVERAEGILPGHDIFVYDLGELVASPDWFQVKKE